MNTKIFLIIVICTFISANVYSQFTFSVSTGDRFELNGANFGYKINDKIVPFVGLQYLNVNSTYEESGEMYNNDLGGVESYTDEGELSGNLYIPNIGLKYFFVQRNKLKAYGSISLFKPIVSAKEVYNGEEDEYLKEILGALSIWGGSVGFGTEYFVDENFSIGGEFGLRSFRMNVNETNDSSFYNPEAGDYHDTEITNDILVCLRPTYTKISLNYYF